MGLTPAQIIHYYYSGGSSAFGLLSDLVNQSGNNGDIKIRLSYSGSKTAGPGLPFQGTYSAAATYSKGDRVQRSSDGYLIFRALQDVPISTPPDPYKSTAYWAIETTAQMTQDMGDGSVMLYSVSLQGDDLIRWGTVARGTISQSDISLSSESFTNSAIAMGASPSTQTIVAAPSAYTFTLPTGLSLFDKVNLGAGSFSLAILGSFATPDFVNIVLPTGQSLAAGDALKLEANSTNFNIARVITYNSTTGEAYLAIINGVGTGTHTSWTCYKVVLAHGTWDSAPTTQYLHLLVDTYNSGTGVTTMTSFVSVGSSARTTWTFREGRTSAVSTGAGTEVQQSGAIRGVMIKGVYRGTRLVHNAVKRAEATGWRYIILEGPNAGDEFTIDCYNATTLNNQNITVASDLAFGPESTGYAFIAFSITSPSGLSTNGRATVYHSTVASNTQSFNYRADIDVFTQTYHIAGGGHSSGEIAWSFKLNGSSDETNWWVDHGYIEASRGRNRTFLVDGVEIETDEISYNPYAFKFQDFETFRLTQVIEAFHPDVVAKMADVTTIHEFGVNGMYFKFNFNPVQDWLVSVGYVHMLVMNEDWFNKFITDSGATFTWPGGEGSTNLTEEQIGWQSALFYSTQETFEESVLAYWWADTSLWRIGEPGVGQSAVGFSGGPKVYPEIFSNRVLATGNEIVVEGRIYAGNKGTLELT